MQHLQAISLQHLKKDTEKLFAFVRISNPQLTIMYDRECGTSDLLNLLTHPEEILNAASSEILKQGRSATVMKSYAWQQMLSH